MAVLGIFFIFWALVVPGVGLIPFETVQVFLQQFSTTGRADSFTLLAWSRITFLMMVFAGVSAIVGGLCLVKGDLLREKTASVFARLKRELGAMQRDFKQFLEAHRHETFWLALITVAGAALRFKFLFSPIRHDEAFNLIYFVRRPVVSILSDYMLANNHVLYTLMVKFSVLLFGEAEWALRIPCFLFGTALVPATWLFAHSFWKSHSRSRHRVMQLVAAALVGASSYLIEYSANSRGYSLLTLWSLLLFIVAARIRVSPENLLAWFFFSLIGALGMITIPTMLIPLTGAFAWLLLTALGHDLLHASPSSLHASPSSTTGFIRRLFCAGVLTGSLALMFYTPILIFTGPESLLRPNGLIPITFGFFLSELPGFLGRCWASWNRDWPFAVQVLLGAGLIAGTAFHFRFGKTRVSPIWGIFAGCVSVLLLMRNIPFVRVWIFVIPFYLTAAVAWISLTRIPSSVLLATLALGIPAATGQALDFGPPGDSQTLQYGRESAQFLRSQLKPGEEVFSPFPDNIMMIYYLQREGLSAALVQPSPASERILIIHSPLSGTFDSHLTKSERTNWNHYTEPRLLAEFGATSPKTSVYEVIRK